MIIELIASLVIQTSNIKETNVDNLSLNRPRSSFVVGDSKYQISEKERIARENYERIRQQTIARDKAERTVRSSTSGTNPYVYGFCTWWVAKEKGITQIWGDAKYWPVNSSVPTAGAIIVTYESWRGHVGIVTEVLGENITIKEMNYVGWGKVSTRVVDYRTLPVKGFLII